MFRNHGIHLANVVADTLALHRLVTNGRSKQHGLKHLLRTMLGVEQPAYKDLFSVLVPKELRVKQRVTHRTDKETGARFVYGTHVTDLKQEMVPLDQLRTRYPGRLQSLYEYATLDALGTYMIYEKLAPVVE